jgi:hypothetical protein
VAQHATWRVRRQAEREILERLRGERDHRSAPLPPQDST